jgi:hypothetical protein
MTVVARFIGGPRNGRKNNLHGNDLPPLRIAVEEKETKAVNMSPGRYEIHDEAEDGQSATYRWRKYSTELA